MTFTEIISALGIARRINSNAFIKSTDDNQVVKVGHIKRLAEACKNLEENPAAVTSLIGENILIQGSSDVKVNNTPTIDLQGGGVDDYSNTQFYLADDDSYFGYGVNNGIIISSTGVNIVTTGTSLKLNVPTYADNTAATGGGLTAGNVYKTASGELRIVV